MHQNNYSAGTATCAANAALPAGTPANSGYGPQGANSGKCAGNEYAVSGLVDWRPVKRVDVYAGAMYSKVNGGLANGFFVSDNLAFTGGVRLSW